MAGVETDQHILRTIESILAHDELAIAGRCLPFDVTIVVVGHESGNSRILLNQNPVASPDINTVDVVKLSLSAVVDADQNLMGHLVTHALNPCGNSVNRRQVANEARIEIYTVDMPVLVTVSVLTVENVATRIRPEERTDTSMTVS